MHHSYAEEQEANMSTYKLSLSFKLLWDRSPVCWQQPGNELLDEKS